MPKNSSKAGHRVKITFHLQLACRGRLACEGGPGCIPSEARDLLLPEMCAPIFDLIGAGRVPWKFRPSQSGHCSKIGSCYPGRAFLARRISPLASCLSVSRGRDIRFFWSAAASLPLLRSQPNRQLFTCGLSLEPLPSLLPLPRHSPQRLCPRYRKRHAPEILSALHKLKRYLSHTVPVPPREHDFALGPLHVVLVH
jgi:hypothetical protein